MESCEVTISNRLPKYYNAVVYPNGSIVYLLLLALEAIIVEVLPVPL
jgi:hypothetical protein